MTTRFPSKLEASKSRGWLLVDAAGVPLGRLASKVAHVMRGKHKPNFAAHVDSGDFVIVVNAKQVKLTGNKLKDKKYYSHSGYAGGLKEVNAESLLDRYPERVIQKAVKGMLPRGKLGHQMLGKLKVYPGSDHPHSAQKPEKLDMETV